MTSLAKITGPSLGRVYARRRIFTLLDSYRHYHAIWLQGAPGDGKTTGIASYLEQSDLHPLWYRCDEGDADPATLFHYLILVASKFGIKPDRSLPAFAPEYRDGLSVFARRFFRELFALLPAPFGLVFDNYQDIPEDATVHAMLQLAIEEIPERCVLVFVSRSDPPVPYSRARANGDFGILGPNLIRFNSEEGVELVRSRSNSRLAIDHVQHIVEQTRGWAAGMVLLCEAGVSNPAVMYTRKADLQLVFDYFAAEILRKLDRKTQDILVTTSLLPMTTAAMAEKLSGDASAGVVLEYLYQHNYFTSRDTQADPVYQYHPLFRQFLLTQGGQLYDQRRLAELRSNAVSLLMSARQWEAAVDLCRIEQDWATLVLLLQEYGPTLVRHGRFATLSGWLEDVGEAVLSVHPWLQYWRGISLLPFNPLASCPIFERAFEAFHEQGNVAGIYLAWTGVAESIRTDVEGDIQRLDPWITLLDQLTSKHPHFPDADVECAVACGMLASLYCRAPQDRKVLVWKDRAIALSMSSDHIHHRASAMQWAILHDLMRGDHARAALYMTVFQSNLANIAADPRMAIAINSVMACYQARIGDFDVALETMHRGLDLVRASGVAVWSHQILGHGVTAAIGKGDLVLADKLLSQIAPFSLGATGFAPIYYHVLVSWRSLLGNDIAKACVHGEAAVSMTRKSAFILFDGYALFGCAQAVFQRGDRIRAHELLFQASSIARKIESRIFEHMCHMVEADFAFAEGLVEDGEAALRTGLALGKVEQYIHFTYWMPSLMSRMCAQALARGIEPEYARHIILQRKLSPPDIGLDEWPWPVRIVTLDHFAVLLDGNPLPFSRKAPKKLISLLKAIIAMGGQDVPLTRLSDALWPEQEADEAVDALEKAVQRLRKMIGDEALLLKAGRVSLNQKYVTVDAWSFDRLLDGSGKDCQAGISKAIALYHKNFLADEDDAPWAIHLRERLHVKFIRAVSTCAHHLMDQGKFSQAIECFEDALAVDNLAEELYQGALICYTRLGRHAEGLALYRRLRQTLSITLGITPSATTEAIRQKFNQPPLHTVRKMER